MSITPYPLRSLTGLIPSIVYGINNAGTSSLELNYEQGLTMNVNGGGIAIQDLNQNSITTSSNTDLQLTSGQGQITMGSYDNVNINPGVNLIVNSQDSIIMNTPNGNISSNATGSNIINGSNVEITSNNGGTQISAPTDTINFITPNASYFNLTTELTGDGSVYFSTLNCPAELYVYVPNGTPHIVSQYATFTDNIYNTSITLNLDTGNDQLPFVNLRDNDGLPTFLKCRQLNQDGHYCFTFENNERFFKQNNPFSLKQYSLFNGDFIEKFMPFVLMEDGVTGLKLREYIEYLDDNGQVGWSCIVSNMNGGVVQIDTGGIDWFAHSNGLSGNPININKWATCRITLIYSQNLSVYRWAVSEF